MWLLFLSVPAIVTWILGRTLGPIIRPYSRTLAVVVCAGLIPGALALLGGYIVLHEWLYPKPPPMDGIPLHYILFFAALFVSPVTFLVSMFSVTGCYQEKE
jgi:hypothetical protein